MHIVAMHIKGQFGNKQVESFEEYHNILECMLSDCNWVNQAQLKQPWSFYSVYHTILPFGILLLWTACDNYAYLCPLSHCIEL